MPIATAGFPPPSEPVPGEHGFRYGDETILFRIRRQPGRIMQRIAIHVEPDGSVLVDAPPDAAFETVLAAIKKRARWISGHVHAARSRLAHVLPHEYASGETLLYLGRHYRLRVRVEPEGKPCAHMRGGFIEVTVSRPEPELVRAALDAWFRLRAREVFADRLQAVAEPLRWVKQIPSLRLRHMQVQWGSCSPAGRLTLNPLLVKAPRECIDYVLLHELCHLLHHNHSPRFYQTLDRHMPHWREVKERLDGMAGQVFRG